VVVKEKDRAAIVAELVECVELLIFGRHDPDWPDCVDRAEKAVTAATGRPPRRLDRGDMVRRADVLALIQAMTVAMAGYDRFADRSQFAAFNLGRFQEKLRQEVERMKGV
jgi:hypothetical protein